MHLSQNITKGILGIVLVSSIIGGASYAQTIPKEYYPNYAIQADREKIEDYFVQIEAAQKIGATVGSEIFAELNTSFKKVFPNFPQEYTFKVVYEQCTQISNSLAQSYSETLFQGFMNNCYKPLNQTIAKINSKYTIVASSTRNPAGGAAPVTVTFDARASKDPSSETIPSRNFYRYYRNTQGIDKIMGIGSVINYTFEEAGNYVVHLTVRSSNVNAKGILDGELDLNINVAPKAASIVVYANAKKLDKNKPTKFGTQEAKKGIVFDGSATMPTGGRRILSHRREISNREGFRYTKDGGGSPSYINVPLNGNGEYIVKLTTIDNESNNVSETFSVAVSDPVAIIKQTPGEGNTSATFTFDAGASYSLTARLKLYTRELFDSEGNKIDTFQGKTIKKQFTKPGNYLVKLTIEDELGMVNVDTKQIYVESSVPVPQFTITPTNKRAQPSEFHLDANGTTDLDVTNKHDSLEYYREFSNPNVTTITATEEENKKIVVHFDEIGKHKVKLIVTDMYGKVASIEKTIDVTSILRPELTVNPGAITRGRNVGFEVRTNKPVIGYQRTFGDGDTRANQESKMTHIYQKIGIYNVTVTVNDRDGNSNSITEKVFIGETGFPIAAFRIKDAKGFFLRTTEFCEITEGNVTVEHPAYRVDRYQNITIDPSLSVNSKGTNADLRFFFQPKYEGIIQQNSLSHRFNEIGCQYIDLTVEDRGLNKQDQQRIWFKVYNALPTLKNLTLSFPQYENESGIGFQENNVQDILAPKSDTENNLIVKVIAVDAKDPDGSISYFKRYYYPKDNPYKILETRITPGNIPYTFFTLPRIAGEYNFGVAMYDNDDGSQKSEDVIGYGKTIFIPQSDKNPDIPIVTLKSNKQTVNIGDEVTFDVIAKITSDNENFYTDRTIYYDFNGDDQRDLITNKDRVTHTYMEANEKGYLPRAAVVYRGYRGEGEGNSVIVRNGVKPILVSNSIGNIVIFRDLSIGELVERRLCFDKKECELGNNKYRRTHIVSSLSTLSNYDDTPITQNKVFIQEYPKYGKYETTIELKSKQGVSVSGEYTITTSNNMHNGRITSGINLITIPETNFNNQDMEIFVSKSMKNSVLFYVHNTKGGRCYIDTDISIDSKGDGNTANNQDIPCNTLQLRKYDPQFESIIGRLYFENEGRLVFKNFYVSFEGFDIVMDQNNKLIYEDITILMQGIEDRSIGNTDLKLLLDILRKNLLDRNQTSANVVAIQTHIQSSSILIDQGQKELLDSILLRLSNADTINAVGGSEYERARNEILITLPEGMKPKVVQMFSQLELAAENLDEQGKKEKLTEILNYISDNASEYELDKSDIDGVILLNICKILEYYNTSSNRCPKGGESTAPSIPNIPTEKTNTEGLPTWLKIILGIIFGGIAIVGLTIVFFAVKAKLREQQEVEDEEE